MIKIMFNSVLIFAVFLTIDGGFVSAQCPQAGITQLQNCYKPFFANFNFTFSTMAPDHEDYVQAKKAFLLSGGMNAFKSFCTWIQTRQNCIGTTYNQECAGDFDGFGKALGVGGSDSFQYAVDYNQENWQCGPGYNDVTQNFYCLENVYDNHFGDLKTCNDQLANSFNSTNPSCNQFIQYVRCFSFAFKKYCNSIGSYVGCELATVYTNLLSSDCVPKLPTCSKNYNSRRFVKKNHQTNQ